LVVNPQRVVAAGGLRGRNQEHQLLDAVARVLQPRIVDSPPSPRRRRGRFAPSPTGPLHLGNLRTALIAWGLCAHRGDDFVVRVEDLDRVAASPAHEAGQLRDLRAIGLRWTEPVLRQSERFDRYAEVLAELRAQQLVYPCYCTRREIRDEIQRSAQAPNGRPLVPGMVPGMVSQTASVVATPSDPDPQRDIMRPADAYPGTCRTISDAARRRVEREGRVAAWRVCAAGAITEFNDLVHGACRGEVDDFVVQRSDGVAAYNLAVVIDDHAQGIGEVVRGDDLLTSTPRQRWLHDRLCLDVPEYAHVPLVVGPDGERLAKRHGAATLTDWSALGATNADVLRALAATLGPVCAATVDALPSAASVDQLAAEIARTIDLSELARTACEVPFPQAERS
jgi:glutamyl-tRNA synthetase